MTTDEVRQKYLSFFKSAPRSHKEISPAPLVLENDPTTLFTSSGMQPLIPYLMGEKHPEGKRLVNSQPSLRTQDIDEVGDSRHTTFFEMLGNWSLGDYFKEEQLTWFWEFLTEELSLSRDKLWVSVFEGDSSVPKDEDSAELWQKLGVPKEQILYYGVDRNWWSRSGTPDKMPIGEIGGPDSEVFYDFGEELKIHENSMFKDEKCHPNCDCGRFLEIGNSVFIEYKKTENGNLEALPQKNVDFGGGLERLTAAINNNPDIFKIDVFEKIIRKIGVNSGKKYEEDKKSFRIIADHMRAANALIKEGVEPGNKLQGYILRRLIRRAGIKMRNLKGGLEKGDLNFGGEAAFGAIEKEVDKFMKTLDRGLREIEKIDKISAKRAFDLYQTYGFPFEVTQEIFAERGQKIDKKEFRQEFEKHQEKSRTASAGAFKGGLADRSEETTKLHTATHLLHAALRKVLGKHVQQKGSNITSERLRFDFTHPDKLKPEEVEEVEKLVNEQIKKDLAVTSKTTTLEEAKKEGALAFFEGKYGEKVKVYTIGNPSANSGPPFSREVCGGPHVGHTGEIGHVRIIKEVSAGSGVRRIYAKAGTLLVSSN